MPAPASHGSDLVDRVLASGPPTVLYQPVVDLTLPSTPVVGYEALARWPGLAGVSAATLFDEAERSMQVAELDRACRAAAVRGALDVGIDTDTALFVNVEPLASLQLPMSNDRALWTSAAARLTVVLEITERKILTDASALLTSIAEARELGWWIAVDDVGSNPDSLAMLEFIRPDMVKLDLRFVQQAIDADAARTLRGVSAYCERTGATLVAEGIETEEQLDRALAVGAVLGQGYLFGHPGLLRPAASRFRAKRVSSLPVADTPYRLLSAKRGYRIASRNVLERLRSDIEHQIADMTDPPIVLIVIRTASPAAAEHIRRLSAFASRSPLVVMLGEGLSREPAPGAYGANIRSDDPLATEWGIVVLGNRSAVAIAACELDESVPPEQRRYKYVMTQDRDLVVAAGVSLLNRLVQQAVV